MVELFGYSLIIILTVGFVGLIGYINLWCRKERAKMTAAEREKHDAEVREEMSIW